MSHSAYLACALAATYLTFIIISTIASPTHEHYASPICLCNIIRASSKNPKMNHSISRPNHVPTCKQQTECENITSLTNLFMLNYHPCLETEWKNWRCDRQTNTGHPNTQIGGDSLQQAKKEVQKAKEETNFLWTSTQKLRKKRKSTRVQGVSNWKLNLKQD